MTRFLFTHAPALVGTALSLCGCSGTGDDEREALFGSGGASLVAGGGGTLSFGTGGSFGAGGSFTAGGSPGTGNAGAGGAPAAGGGVPQPRPPCISSPGEQVALVGDSYITGFGTPPLQPELAKLVPTASAYPNYAGAGCSMASGGICTGLFGNVPQQVTTVLTQRRQLKLLIMDGGGNDVLIPDTFRFPGAAGGACVSPGSSTRDACQQIVQAAMDMASSLMTQAGAAGVRDVVYFFYPHLPPDLPGTLAGPDPNEILDYALVRARTLCDDAVNRTAGQLRCHFIDLVPLFDGKQAQFIAADHVHPTLAGQTAIVGAIRDVMVAECLGQPASSGCCEP